MTLENELPTDEKTMVSKHVHETIKHMEILKQVSDDLLENSKVQIHENRNKTDTIITTISWAIITGFAILAPERFSNIHSIFLILIIVALISNSISVIISFIIYKLRIPLAVFENGLFTDVSGKFIIGIHNITKEHIRYDKNECTSIQILETISNELSKCKKSLSESKSYHEKKSSKIGTLDLIRTISWVTGLILLTIVLGYYVIKSSISEDKDINPNSYKLELISKDQSYEISEISLSTLQSKEKRPNISQP